MDFNVALVVVKHLCKVFVPGLLRGEQEQNSYLDRSSSQSDEELKLETSVFESFTVANLSHGPCG